MPSLSSFCAVRKALHSALDDEGADAARPRRRIGLGIDHQRVGDGAVGDPHFAPLSTKRSPGFSARVLIDTTSEPALGSDMASAPTCSPVISLGR